MLSVKVSLKNFMLEHSIRASRIAKSSQITPSSCADGKILLMTSVLVGWSVGGLSERLERSILSLTV